MEIVYGIVGFFVIGIIAVILMVSNTNKRLEENLNSLRAEGFRDDHILKGTQSHVAFDLTQRAIAFVDENRAKKLSFDDITSWKHTYTETNTTVNGRHRHSINNNALEFTLKDIDEPLIRVSVHSHGFGNEWMARLSAIVNHSQNPNNT